MPERRLEDEKDRKYNIRCGLSGFMPASFCGDGKSQDKFYDGKQAAGFISKG